MRFLQVSIPTPRYRHHLLGSAAPLRARLHRLPSTAAPQGDGELALETELVLALQRQRVQQSEAEGRQAGQRADLRGEGGRGGERDASGGALRRRRRPRAVPRKSRFRRERAGGGAREDRRPRTSTVVGGGAGGRECHDSVIVFGGASDRVLRRNGERVASRLCGDGGNAAAMPEAPQDGGRGCLGERPEARGGTRGTPK